MRKLILAAGVLFNLGLLSYYKYTDFFIQNINIIINTNFSPLKLVLPLAISFFTFQQLAYLFDCYRYETQEYNFLNYCLFVTFFPQLIAGPIVHHKEMMPQFSLLKNLAIDWRNINIGLFIFFIGLFKKVVIADTFAVWANMGFNSNELLSFVQAWQASISYTMQIYFDFSGYTDMAIGAALFFNIHLPINFNSPYKATNIQEFWRRWHITLTRWLRDYIYIPLGGNRKSTYSTYTNILITFLLGGLWHGAGWTFIIWGLLHGLALITYRVWTNYGFKLPSFLAWLITFLFLIITWVFFRANSFRDAINILTSMFYFQHFDVLISESLTFLVSGLTALYADLLNKLSLTIFIIPVSLVSVFFLPNTVQMIDFVPYRGTFVYKQNILTACSLGLIAAIAITSLFLSGSSEFLYFNF